MQGVQKSSSTKVCYHYAHKSVSVSVSASLCLCLFACIIPYFCSPLGNKTISRQLALKASNSQHTSLLLLIKGIFWKITINRNQMFVAVMYKKKFLPPPSDQGSVSNLETALGACKAFRIRDSKDKVG